MEIKNLQYIVPTKNSPIGSISFYADIPIMYKEGMEDIKEEESKDVELSSKTVELMQKLADSIIQDLLK